jgi:hypothetical protein
MTRDSIPAEIKRAVLVEAGHRCAIPTCRATTTEIAHIVPWAETKEHSFDNLIALCPNCHTRYDQKKEIDRKAMQMYKEALRPARQKFAETILLGQQELELKVNPKWEPIFTIHYWKYDCDVEKLILKSKDGNGPCIAATILDIIIDGHSAFDGDQISIFPHSDTSEGSTRTYNLVVRHWNIGSKVEFKFTQIGGGVGYQLLIMGTLR